MDGSSVDLDLSLVFVGASVTSPAPKFLPGGIFTGAHYWISHNHHQTGDDITHTSHTVCYCSLLKPYRGFPADAFVESRCVTDLLGRLFAVGPPAEIRSPPLPMVDSGEVTVRMADGETP